MGPKELVEICCKIGREYPDIEFRPIVYSAETEALRLFEQHREHLDLWLFMGIWPYYKVREHYAPEDLRVHMLAISPQTCASVYQGLAQVLAAGHDPRCISIDTLPVTEIEQAYLEIGLSCEETRVKELHSAVPLEQVTDFHLSLWQSGDTCCALTYLKGVYENLKRAGVTVFRGVPSQAAIRESIARLALEREAIRAARSQIVVGMMRTEQSLLEPRKKQRLYELLLGFAERTGASVVPSEAGEYLLFLTQGALAEATSEYSRLPLLNQIHNEIGIAVCCGFGIAPTAHLSQYQARTALDMCRQQGGNCAFVLNYDGSVVGPVGRAPVAEYSRRSMNPRIMQIAEKSGLSVATVTKIAGIIKKMGTHRLTAHDVARELGIAQRNGRRILALLEKAGVAVVEGLEQPVARGRPRKVYAVRL